MKLFSVEVFEGVISTTKLTIADNEKEAVENVKEKYIWGEITRVCVKEINKVEGYELEIKKKI